MLKFEPQPQVLKALAGRVEDAELAELSQWFSETDLSKIDWPAEGAPLGFASITYLDRFRTRLIDSKRFDSEEIDAIMKHARGYAGGVASGVARRSRTEEEGDETADIAANEHYFQFPALARVNVDLEPLKAGEMSQWLQITPKSGAKFSHPRYGNINFDRKTAEEMVAHFNNRVYQEHIPVDAEHQTKLSGALGYYRELRVRPDGAVEARIELTDRGKAAIANGGFRYFSPEFYRSWEDPATGQSYSNLLVGGAFTSRPFFKDQHLAPLAANEGSIATWNMGGTAMPGMFKRDAEGQLILDEKGEPQLTDEAQAEVEEVAVKKFRETNKITDDVLDKISKPDPTEEAKAFAEQFPEVAERLVAAERRNHELTMRDKTARFTEVARGRGGEGDGAPWLGSTEAHVKHMIALSERFGEDSAEFEHYITLNREHAAQAREAGLFSEKGSNSGGKAKSSQDEAWDKAQEIAAERGITFGEALDLVMSGNPSVYNESLE